MITLIETLNFRALRHVNQRLGAFHVLVGPNASGKTTFLDVVSLLGTLVSEGLDAAVGARTRNFPDLTWRRSGGSFQLAVEARIPEERRRRLGKEPFDAVRYEVCLGLHPRTEEIAILAERVLLKWDREPPSKQRPLFPMPRTPPRTILTPKAVRGTKTVVNKVPEGNDDFYDETGKGWDHSFRLGPRKSALGNLPDDESRFPASTWLKRFLAEGVQSLVLNSLLIRQASPPGQAVAFKMDGSNLPWVVAHLERNKPDRLRQWVAHLRTALPDLEHVRTIERPDDRHRYLVLGYGGGLEVPSWTASDGTLRLLALTLPAYLPDVRGVFLVEEPENGIHPRAVETLFQSLSSVYDAQVLLATHSPVILSVAGPEYVLCFAKTEEGATDIVRGTEHPALRAWHGETNLGVLFASGVLG
ncbi:MAG: ATP-binding protein [Chloroflexi bacterium]|nr:ATP-binding protein [Chloroflexota bacterium]